MTQDYREEEIDIAGYLKVIYKYRRMIMTIVFTAMVFAGFSSLLKPSMYEASATFFPMNTSYGIQSQGVVIQPKLDIKDLIISILESRKMADKIIEQLELKKIWNLKLTSAVRERLDKLSDISINKNGIIKLSVIAESPELSANIANAYVDNLDYFNRELDIGANKQIVQVIDRATIPEERASRGVIRNILVAGISFFIIAILLAFFVEFIRKENLSKKIKGS